MKKVTLILIAAIISAFQSSAMDDKKVKSSIKDVTVFLQGAQVHRSGNFRIEKGQTRIVFEGMTQNFDKNSIQVKGKGDFIILDVSTNIFYPVPEAQPVTTIPDHIYVEIDEIENSMLEINWQLNLINKKLTAYQQELNMLNGSGVFKGLPQSDSIAALVDAMDYMRIKVQELNLLIHESEKEKSELQSLNQELQTRLTELKNYNANSGYVVQQLPPVQQIMVTVQSDKVVNGSLDVSYMVWSAGWSPSYDLRADDISSPTKLTYKAKVYQSTGIDWNNVNVKLSTINPNLSNNKPIMAPWYLDFYQEIQAVDELTRLSKKDAEMKESNLSTLSYNSDFNAYSGNVTLEEVDAEHVYNYTQMSENLTMVEFDLKMKYSIASNGKEHLMAIKSEEIPTKYQYYAVPRLDKDAFLLAKLTDWEELNLLPAVANIYYDGTYVGQTRINPDLMTDTMDLALGRDREILINRKKAKVDKEEKFYKTDVVKTYKFEIVVRNNKTVPLNIIIEDQMPVTENEDIKITLADKGGAKVNKKKGFLEWSLDITPKDSERVEFKYTIKHDKDQELTMN